ncbi:hypothetical protein BHE74_00009160 [Ensete ventricosum]|nr:hypothetical protein BHE74_00009160 [Ensete ventricosum]
MEDPEGALSFDFEGGLDSAAPTAAAAPLAPADPTAAAATAGALPHSGAADPTAVATGNVPGRRSFRQTVCRHWLRGLCMKGDACGFLHQYDKERMPVCRFFRLYGECREQDCVYKHTNEDIKECNMSLIVLVASEIVPSSPSSLSPTPLSIKGIDDFTKLSPLRYHGAAMPMILLSVVSYLRPFLRDR